MSDPREQATQLWTQLVEAMRADGIIAACILQAGPATAHLVMQTCETINTLNAKPAPMPWLKATIKPPTGRLVLAQEYYETFRVAHWNDNTKVWRSAETGDELQVVQWQFIEESPVAEDRASYITVGHEPAGHYAERHDWDAERGAYVPALRGSGRYDTSEGAATEGKFWAASADLVFRL